MSIVDVHALVYERSLTMKELQKHVLPALDFGINIKALKRPNEYFDFYVSEEWVKKQHQHSLNRKRGQKQ